MAPLATSVPTATAVETGLADPARTSRLSDCGCRLRCGREAWRFEVAFAGLLLRETAPPERFFLEAVFCEAAFLEAAFLEAALLKPAFLEVAFLEVAFLEAVFLEAAFLEEVPLFLAAVFFAALFLEAARFLEAALFAAGAFRALPPVRDFEAVFLGDLAMIHSFTSTQLKPVFAEDKA